MTTRKMRNFWVGLNGSLLAWDIYWWINDPAYAWLYAICAVMAFACIVYWLFFATVTD